MISPQDFQKLKYDTLKYFWGYTGFRDSQEEIINAVISEKDTLVLLPTGAGKSLCYQLPALLKEGTCLVISPLLALMKDQVNQLKFRGIEAEYLLPNWMNMMLKLFTTDVKKALPSCFTYLLKD
jgi:ATP-dependent DNA helicase RecQ